MADSSSSSKEKGEKEISSSTPLLSEEKKETFSPVFPFAKGVQSLFRKPEDQASKLPPVVKPLPENFGSLLQQVCKGPWSLSEKRKTPVSDEGFCVTLTPEKRHKGERMKMKNPLLHSEVSYSAPVFPVGGGSYPPPVFPAGGGYQQPPVFLVGGGSQPPPAIASGGQSETPRVISVGGGADPAPVIPVGGGSGPPPAIAVGGGSEPPPEDKWPFGPSYMMTLSAEKRQKFFGVAPPSKSKGTTEEHSQIYTVKRGIDSKMFPFATRMSFAEKPLLKPLTEEELQDKCLRPRPEKCITGTYITPYCKCSEEEDAASIYSSRFSGKIESWMVLPDGALEEHRSDFIPIWLAYNTQIRQSHCFEVDDHPGSCSGAVVVPLPPSTDFNSKDGVLMELAIHAIHKYNKEDGNVYKYKVLEIEKANFSTVRTSMEYWMTVKVLNLTLANPIETFQIHAGVRTDTAEKFIYCCHPKEEVIVGFPCCDVCLGKLNIHRYNIGGTRTI